MPHFTSFLEATLKKRRELQEDGPSRIEESGLKTCSLKNVNSRDNLFSRLPEDLRDLLSGIETIVRWNGHTLTYGKPLHEHSPTLHDLITSSVVSNKKGVYTLTITYPTKNEYQRKMNENN